MYMDLNAGFNLRNLSLKIVWPTTLWSHPNNFHEAHNVSFIKMTFLVACVGCPLVVPLKPEGRREVPSHYNS